MWDKKFGVNLTRLAPGAQSALLHRHSVQEEFIFILEGQPSLVTDVDEFQLQPGMCAGFTPDGVAHKLINRTSSDVIYLEIGDRTEGDKVHYPNDDLVAVFDSNGQWQFSRKNGEFY
nr:cupin domain-containing protein [Legionella sainthelensi]